MLRLIVVIAVGIALAPYILPLLGWALAVACVVLALGAMALLGERVGQWYDATRVGRWHNRVAGSR